MTVESHPLSLIRVMRRKMQRILDSHVFHIVSLNLFILTTASFGQGIDGIPVFAFALQLGLLFAAYSSSWLLFDLVFVWLSYAIGTIIASYRTFGIDKDSVGIVMMVGASFVLSTLTVCFVLFPAARIRMHLFSRKAPELHMFLYPTCMTGAHVLLALVLPLGSIMNPGYIASRGFFSLKAFSSLIGIDGLNFVVAFTSAIIFELLEMSGLLWSKETFRKYAKRRQETKNDNTPQTEQEEGSTRRVRSSSIASSIFPKSPYNLICGPGTTLVLTVTIVLCYGGSQSINAYHGFFQSSSLDLAQGGFLSVSCFVSHPADELNAHDMNDLQASNTNGSSIDDAQVRSRNLELITDMRAKIQNIQHPDIVIWSEGLAKVYTDEQENALLTLCAKMSRDYSVLVSASYFRFHEDRTDSKGKMKFNDKVALFRPDGELAFFYEKQNIIPGLEGTLLLKSKSKNTNNTPKPRSVYLGERLGRVGVAIGWDYVFPSFIHRAGMDQVDIMLNPSWDWSTAGFFLAEISAMRSLENGFSMIRCASNGVSGVYDPWGQVVYRKITTRQGSAFTVDIPRIPHILTPYVFIGEVFGYLSLCLTGITFIIAITPLSILSKFMSCWCFGDSRKGNEDNT